MANYIALIHKEADRDCGLSFPDFLGCVSAGPTLDDACTGAEEALALKIEGMMEDNEPILELTLLEDVMNVAESRDGAAVLVKAPPLE